MNKFVTNLPEKWQEKWKTKRFTVPSPIQEAIFESLKKKESLIAISPTGSGKTLAYLLPLLMNVEKKEASSLLILASSQELAIQVAKVTREWAKERELHVQFLVGGANVKRQIEGLKKKPEILIGTPGRVLELVKTKKLKAHQIKTIVFDEADQLFNADNVQIIEQIFRQAPVEYQLTFFSATADRSIEQINRVVGKTLKVIDVTGKDESTKGIKHYFLKVPARKKEDYLRRLVHMDGFQGLVFFNKLNELGVMEEKLNYHGIPVASLASDQNNLLRQAALEQFKEKKINILFTTDVAARGLDIDHLSHVVNAEVPISEESYIHRSGRTGRMGNDGVVITFIQDNTIRDLKKIMRHQNVTIKEVFLHGGFLQEELSTNEESSSEQKAKPKNAPSKKKKKIIKKDNKEAPKKKGLRRK